MPIDVRITLLICLHSFSICIFISLIPVYVCLKHAFPSSSTFIHTYRHINMFICFDYSVMTPYNLFAPLTKRLCVPAPSGVTWCLHTCEPMSQSVCFSHHACLRFLWMHIHHVHMKQWNYVCTHLRVPSPRLHSSPIHVPTWEYLHHVW